MTFFHVLVKFKSAPDKARCVFSDLSRKDLESKFLKPYRAGRSTLSGAEVIETGNIAWTQIMETERGTAEELKDIQAKSWKDIEEFNRNSSVVLISAGHGYDAEDIVDAGNDVTSQFITSPPGEGSSVIIKIMNHQWVIAVIGGLIVAGLAAWLRWA
ncbi:MAG: hypothetical protein IH604_14460 [Burkholderiales bacterium]|nr:hypothetical protein [Burkholderiales bacterium]